MNDGFAQEEWRAIVGYPGYEVSNLGRVRSYRKTGLGGLRDTPRPVKPMGNRGYLVVNLWNSGELKTKKIYRLVCESFIGPSDLPVNHINGKKDDNRLCNLEYVTPSENAMHSARVLGNGRGTKVNTAKLSEAEVLEIARRCATGESSATIAEDYGVTRGTVCSVGRGGIWAWLTRQEKEIGRKGTKLLRSDVVKICKRIASGEPHRLIALDFNVSKSSVDRISQGRSWGWMAEVKVLRQSKG